MKVDMNIMQDEEQAVETKPKKPKRQKRDKTPAVPEPVPETTDPESSEPEQSETDKPEDVKQSKPSLGDMIKSGALFRMNKFWLGICIVFFLILLSVNSNMSNQKTRLTVQLRNAAGDVTGIQSAIDEVKLALEEQEKIDSLTLSDDEEEEASNNATEQGEQVASLQNVYKTVSSSDNKEAFDNNVDALDALFTDDSKEARVAWYGYQDSVAGTWEFASKAGFSGNTSKVLWLCWSDSDSTLLAYCTGTYHADTKLFSDVSYNLTKYMSSIIETDDTGSEGDPSGISSMIDVLKAITNDDSASAAEIEGTPSPETIEQNNDISEARENYKTMVQNGEAEGEGWDSDYNPGVEEKVYDTEEGGSSNETDE